MRKRVSSRSFNSLDAQREACAAYVASHKAEGWVLLPTVYEDGGISGGTLERPGLQVADTNDTQLNGGMGVSRRRVHGFELRVIDETSSWIPFKRKKQSDRHRLYVLKKLACTFWLMSRVAEVESKKLGARGREMNSLRCSA